MANIFEFLSKDGNITPEKARKSRQMQFHDKTAYVWMGILPLKKRVNRDKCSFATKQRMLEVFAIDEILRYRGTWFPGSRTLCHPGPHVVSQKGRPKKKTTQCTGMNFSFCCWIHTRIHFCLQIFEIKSQFLKLRLYLMSGTSL